MSMILLTTTAARQSEFHTKHMLN